MAQIDPPAFPLSPRAARVFYNVVDAWFPPDPPSGLGGGDFDLLADTLAQLAGSQSRRLEAVLGLVEWLPRCVFGRRGFCALSRGQRQRWLGRLERLPFPALRSCLRDLRAAAARAHRSASETVPGEIAAPRAQASSPDP